ncbi:MAG: SpvB/TcaC N-terminal domain-containing protein, partial [Burkholderiales bacterium]
VTLTSPANGATLLAPATVSLAATASDPDGTVTKVEFYRSGSATPIATVTNGGSGFTAPSSFASSWSGVAAGTYAISARAYDNLGSITNSQAVNITVNAAPSVFPSATLTASGAPYTAPATANLSLMFDAAALVAGETISQVIWQQGSSTIETLPNPAGSTWSKSITSLAVGTYDFGAQITTSAGRVVNANRVSVVVSAPESAAAQVCLPEQIGVIPGATAGQASVSEMGGATYTIAVTTPPGTAGLVPNVAISYGSQGGNGPLGVGWGLQGFSNIHRCPRTLYSDNARGSINFDSNDRFCMDGMRLVPVGTLYGGTEYRTEKETYTRIVGYTASGVSGPAYFRAWTKDGKVLTYGNTIDSSLSPVAPSASLGTAYKAWALSRVEDRSGNYMLYSYISDNGNLLPDEVNYTGHTSGALPYARIKFIYENRSVDDQPLLFGSVGASTKLTKRVQRIETSADGASTRRYTFAYSNSLSTARTLLQSVQECSGDGVSCLAPTTFAAAPTAGVMNAFSSGFFRGFSMQGPGLLINDWNPIRQPFVADFNGDGRSDILYQAYSGNWILCFANTDPANEGFTCSTVAMPDLPFSDELGNAQRYLIEVGDFNGDGRADVLVFPVSVGYETPPSGDGIVDPDTNLKASEARIGTTKPLSNKDIKFSGHFRVQPGAIIATKEELRAARLALRGKSVAFSQTKSGTPANWKLCLSSGTGLSCVDKTLIDPGLDLPSPDMQITSATGDFNGDGLTDLILGRNDLGVTSWWTCSPNSNSDFACATQTNLLP